MNHRSAAIEIHYTMTPWIFHAAMTALSQKKPKKKSPREEYEQIYHMEKHVLMVRLNKSHYSG